MLVMVPVSPIETQWPHTHAACRVERHVETLRRGEVVKRAHDQTVYVGSFSFEVHTPECVQKLIRGYWGIDNQLHHPKDRSMAEDRRHLAGKPHLLMKLLASTTLANGERCRAPYKIS